MTVVVLHISLAIGAKLWHFEYRECSNSRCVHRRLLHLSRFERGEVYTL